jgi:hypothetical protein
MPKIAVVSLLIFALGVEPVSFNEFDLYQRALTQGGLLIVVLVLLYFQRRDGQAKHRENSGKIELLTDIAERSAVASEKAAAAGEANAYALNRLSAAVENFERRR